MSTRQLLWSPDEIAILRSVLYASLFEYPLTLPEVRQSLLERVQDESAILRTYRASSRLQRHVEYRDGFFFPRGRAAWIPERRRRRTISLSLLDRNRRMLKLICAIPFVRLVALSGSVASLNADRGADVDLFVMTRGRHAWTVTLAVVLLAKLARRRRVICANYVMADTELTIARQDVFSANQVIHLRPVIGADAFRDLLAANPFVERLYPNFSAGERPALASPLSAPVERLKRLCEVLFAIPSVPVEALCRRAYGWHLGRQTTSWRTPDDVRLSTDCLKLHSRSHRAAILGRFDWLCGEALEDGRIADEVLPEAGMPAQHAVNS
jgi:hypothetical protein